MLLFLSLFCCVASAQEQKHELKLSGKISKLVNVYQKQNPRTQIGVSIVDIKTTKSVYSHNSNTALIPASNQKLLTTAFALERLGVNFKFRTKVLQLGDNIVIVGDFDPTLGDPIIAAAKKKRIYHALDIWAADLKKNTGNVLRHFQS